MKWSSLEILKERSCKCKMGVPLKQLRLRNIAVTYSDLFMCIKSKVLRYMIEHQMSKSVMINKEFLWNGHIMYIFNTARAVTSKAVFVLWHHDESDYTI